MTGFAMHGAGAHAGALMSHCAPVALLFSLLHTPYLDGARGDHERSASPYLARAAARRARCTNGKLRVDYRQTVAAIAELGTLLRR